jgi:hypothetical protein
MTDAELGGGLGKGLAEILRAAIGMKNSSGLECVITGGHAQRVDEQRSAHVIGDCVPDAFLRAAVNDRGQVSEALPGREIRDITNELGARCGGARKRRPTSGARSR